MGQNRRMKWRTPDCYIMHTARRDQRKKYATSSNVDPSDYGKT